MIHRFTGAVIDVFPSIHSCICGFRGIAEHVDYHILVKNKFPVTALFLYKDEPYANLVAGGLPLGIKPWTFDIEART